MNAEYKRAGVAGIGLAIVMGFLILGLSVFLAFLFPPFLIIGIIGAILSVVIGGPMYASNIIGPCPHCHRNTTGTQPGGAFNCLHCKNRVLVTQHNPRFIKPGEPDVFGKDNVLS